MDLVSLRCHATPHLLSADPCGHGLSNTLWHSRPTCQHFLVGGALSSLGSLHRLYVISNYSLDFPGGPVLKNPPASAGNTASAPWSRKIPYAEGQLSPSTTATKPVLWSLCFAVSGAAAMSSPSTTTKNSPRSPQREKIRRPSTGEK